jgi:hypothetical protein
VSKTAPSDLEVNRELQKFLEPGSLLRIFLRKELQWLLVALIGVAYLMSLTPGHALIPDDYAAYIMHAANIVEGRPYSEIKFIANPDAMWIGPAEGYPPVYPLMLTPVYKFLGVNFRAMKVITVACFVIFLILFLRLIDPIVPRYGQICLLLVIAVHPFFREYGDYVLSEMPYLMFSFAVLLMIEVWYQHLDVKEWRFTQALFLAVLIYCAYGTRTIGITLLGALGLMDLVRFKRPSRFFCVVLFLTLSFVAIQMKALTAPHTYVRLTNFSPSAVAGQFVVYSKRLSYVWANGWSRPFQILLALMMTAFAAVGFARALWLRKSATEFYLLVYLGILSVYTVNLYDRGLLPILPLYFLYVLEGVLLIGAKLSRELRLGLAGALALVVSLAYSGNSRARLRAGPGPNTEDIDFKEMCAFIRENTAPSDVVAFPKPRSLTLFTNRPAAGLGWDETPAQAAQFLRDAHVGIVVEAGWQHSVWEDSVVNEGNSRLIYRNSSYKVLRMKGM